MKIRNLLLLFVCCFAALCAKAQTEIPRSEVKTVKINCPDSLGFITNHGIGRTCEFYFLKNEETPDMFYVEDFSHQDFYNTIYKNDKSKITRVKLVRESYTPAIHDFVFCYNKDNQLLFCYILKDWHEKKQLTP